MLGGDEGGTMTYDHEVRWAETAGITWDNAAPAIKEGFALTRLFWFFRMVDIGGPDGSDLDAEVATEAREAADWYGPILEKRAERAQ